MNPVAADVSPRISLRPKTEISAVVGGFTNRFMVPVRIQQSNVDAFHEPWFRSRGRESAPSRSVKSRNQRRLTSAASLSSWSPCAFNSRMSTLSAKTVWFPPTADVSPRHLAPSKAEISADSRRRLQIGSWCPCAFNSRMSTLSMNRGSVAADVSPRHLAPSKAEISADSRRRLQTGSWFPCALNR